MSERTYTSKRFSIVEALAEKFKEIDGTGTYLSNLGPNVFPRLKFWDEVEEFPAVHMALGTERREYQGGGYKDRFLAVTLRCYVKAEEPEIELERLLEDLETVIEQNGRLAYQDSQGVAHSTQDITIISIDTDEGVLAPLGVGEVILQVRY